MKNKWIIAVIAVLILGGVWFAFSKNDVDQGSVSQNIGISVGDLSPDFTFTTITGELISNSDLVGKTIVITSSAAWCNTCVIEAKEFAQAYPNFNNDEVIFITVDIDPRNTIEAIQEFQLTTNSPWHYTNAMGGRELIDELKLNRFEITYVIDGDGIIQFKDRKITSAAELISAIQMTL